MTERRRPMRVLAAVDFGDASATATALAGALAAASGGELTVLHAETMEAPPYFTAAQVQAVEAARLQARSAAADYVRTFAAAHTTAPIEPRVVEDSPVKAILDASRDFDVVVLGTHGRRGPRRWWLGSVAAGVLRDARVPVLVTCALPAATVTRLTRRLASMAPDPRVGWTDVLGAVLEVPAHSGDPAVVIAALRSCATPVLYVPDLIST